MLKRIFLLSGLVVFIFLVSGCGTIGKGACGFAQGLSQGAKEDWSWLTKTVSKSDDWMKTNLW